MPPENLHLTLAFLGHCPSEWLPCFLAVGTRLKTSDMTFTLDRLGHFPKARVLWLGMQTPPLALFDLRTQLVEALALDCKWPLDTQDFVPHVTIRRATHQPCVWPPGLEPITWRVDTLALVESLSHAQGVRYLPLRCWPLENAQ